MTNTGMTRRFTTALLAVAMLALLPACSDDDGDGDVKTVVGTAVSVLNDAVQAQRDFVVVDLAQPEDAPPVASGTSDSNGQFVFSIKGSTRIIVVFPPSEVEPRTSGLFSVGETANGKTLKDATDIACVAGVTAVRSGELDVNLLTQARIANLEAAAQQVLDEGDVDFTDSEAVAAAAAEVRARTNDGANPPT